VCRIVGLNQRSRLNVLRLPQRRCQLTNLYVVNIQKIIIWFLLFIVFHSTGLLVHVLLTYSMVQSPSWEAYWFAASQEIPRISQNPKVHYRTHKRPPAVSILDQPNPVHIPTSHLLQIHPNIIHPSTPRSPKWSPSLTLIILTYLLHGAESFLRS